MLALDYTIIIQAINFLLLLWLLNRFMYKPILNILEERSRKTTGTLKDVEELEADTSQMLQNYERGLREAKIKAHEERNRIRLQGVEKERDILDEARKNALESINNFRRNIENDAKEALDSLKRESQKLSSEIVKRILYRKVG
jgi:F-type H+-transporting ATPase subunit b